MRTIELTKRNNDSEPVSINPEFIIKFEEYNTVINKEPGTIIYLPGEVNVIVKESYEVVKANLRNV